MSQRIMSSPDKIAFTMEVRRRIKEYAAMHMQKKGEPLRPEGDILRAFSVWRVMDRRYQIAERLEENTWHTAEEQNAEQDIAEWLISATHELNGTQQEFQYERRAFD